MIYTLTLNPAVDKEYTVAGLAMDEVLRAEALRVDFGGKGFNVSRMLANLGLSSVALGLVGGRAGELLRDGLAMLDIATDFIWIAGETRTNLSIVSAGRKHYVKVNEPGPTVTAEEAALLMEKVRGLVRPGDWWVLAGSLPPGLPTGIYADLIAEIQAGGANAVLDTVGAPLELGCRARPALVKPNAVEAAGLTGSPVENDAQAAQAAAAITALGPARVVLSLGKNGALWSDGRTAWVGRAPQIAEGNPIGAGDAMVAGLVARLALGAPPPEALRWGIACGAATAGRPGTEMASLAFIEALLTQILVEEAPYAV